MTDEGGIVYAGVVLDGDKVWLCHWRICSVGVETNIFAYVRSQQPEVPHLQPQLHLFTPIELAFL